MKRSFNADFINSVLNHPDVMEGSELKGLTDVTDAIADVNNVLLTNNYGGFIYIKVDAMTYEVHTQFLPNGRGAKAYHAALESLRYMFVNTDCVRVISKASPDNIGACQLAEKCLNLKGYNGTYNYYSLEYRDWVERDKENKRVGHEFHSTIGDSTNHDEDDTHDYHVGAALSIALAGNALKAQQVYNYWAIASGYEQVTINSFFPLIMTVGDMRLLIDKEVMLCQ